MSAPVPAAPDVGDAGEDHSAAVQAVARGGALNLAGAVVYGASNFVLLYIFNSQLGVEATGIALVAIGIFSIATKFSEIGCSTGFIRTISRLRALDRQDEMRATFLVGVVPVFTIGLGAAALFWLAAPTLADVFTGGAADPTLVVQATEVIRSIAPFLPFAALHSVVVQGTRGFDTMVPQTAIEKIGRAVLMPVGVFTALQLGADLQTAMLVWASTNLVALVPSLVAFRRLIARERRGDERPDARLSKKLAVDFWRYTAPRAIGQVFEVSVNWLDTILVAALVSPRAAGIYGSGTRYLLIGTFTADAIMQVVGARVSGLMARGRTAVAQEVLRRATSWQVLLVWPTYLLVGAFSATLLGVFGDDVIEAQAALLALSGAVLVASLFGPSASVVLMAGRSRTSLLNTAVALTINVGGNLLLVERYGITAAGIVWAVTLIVAAVLPAWQANRQLHVRTWGRPGFVAAGCALVGVGVPALVARTLLGDSWAGLGSAALVGGLAYVLLLRHFDHEVSLGELAAGLLRRPSASTATTGATAAAAGSDPSMTDRRADRLAAS